MYDRGGNRVSLPVLYGLLATALGLLVFAALAISPAPNLQPFVPLNILQALGLVKVGTTLVKNIPQIILHYRRKSTEGWSVQHFVLDFLGGLLSLGQLLLDCAVRGDWTAVTGNVGKALLGVLSMAYDVMLLTQHYVLYRKPCERLRVREERVRLLGGEGGREELGFDASHDEQHLLGSGPGGAADSTNR